MNKKVSIIVPVYNAEKYLVRSLNSILNQTYKNLEIIIIDDCSTDNSKKIIKEYALKDNRIIPFYSEINQGVSKSRNIGLSTFSGDYVVFVDADDFMVKDCIEIMVNAAYEYDSDIVDSYHMIVYENKGKKYYFTEGKVPKNVLVMGNLEDNIEILDKATYITGKLIDKKVLNNLYFDENLKRYEDLVFEHILKKRIKNMVFLNDVMYYYVQVSGSLINTLGEKHLAYLDAAKEVINNYSDSSNEIKLRIESLLFTNAFLTGITKIIKNDKTDKENADLLIDYFQEFNNIFKTWKTNKYINRIIKNRLKKYQYSFDKTYKLVKRTKKINFIKLYFKYLSIRYKYKQQ